MWIGYENSTWLLCTYMEDLSHIATLSLKIVLCLLKLWNFVTLLSVGEVLPLKSGLLE